ncbi:hypothetical protein EI555_007463, partial [Monodon monoceros]
KLQHLAPEQGLAGEIGPLRVSKSFGNSRVTVMGNSHSVEFQYIRLLKQLLRSSGVKVKPESFDELFALTGEDFSDSSDEGAFSDDDKEREQTSKQNEMPLSQQNEISDIRSKCLLWLDYRIGTIGLDAEEKWLGFLLILLGEASLIRALLAPPEEKGDLWKLMTALKKINAWVGHVVNKSGNHSLTFHENVTRYTRSCEKLPYILLKGPAVWNKTQDLLKVCISYELGQVFDFLSILEGNDKNLFLWLIANAHYNNNRMFNYSLTTIESHLPYNIATSCCVFLDAAQAAK